MKKSYLIMAAIASVALVSCSNEEFVGELDPGSGSVNQGQITFGTFTPRITRAEGAEAAGLLNNQFIFAGTKGDNPTSYVFDQYVAKYVANTAGSTLSNTENWEYVSYDPAPTNTQMVAYNSNSTLPKPTQSIKYWDYAESQYDFAAFSTGAKTAVVGDPGTEEVQITAINASTKAYTLKGSTQNLLGCYISDLVTVPKAQYGNPVEFSFRSLGTKIRLAFYETVPGYSVKDVKFYEAATGNLLDEADATNGEANKIKNKEPKLFATSKVLPYLEGSGTMAVSFTNNKANVAFSTTDAENNLTTSVKFGGLADLAIAEKLEKVMVHSDPTDNTSTLVESPTYIGRTSNSATYAGGLANGAGKYYDFLPYGNGTNLQLRIKYTLVSTDGSGEEMTVDNATAVIPAELTNWLPNYAYTYIFKISDMTNGYTGFDTDGTTPVCGLTPITLDAVVVNAEENGVQETITTVATPSITTYTKGKVVTVSDDYEYAKNANIYVVVNSGTSNETLVTTGTGINAALFTATIQDGAAQTISEESVENLFKTYETEGTNSVVYDGTNKTYTATDANNKTMVLTESTLLTASTKITADDSPTGNDITVPGAVFKPTEAGIYVFRYTKTAYEAAYYTATAAGTYTEGTYYTYNAATQQFTVVPTIPDGGLVVGTTYYTRSGDEGSYTYTAVESTATYDKANNDYFYFDGKEYKQYDESADLNFASTGTSYYTRVPAEPGEYFYKVIIVK